MPASPRPAVTIFHNPACGTSRKTLALIQARGIEPQVVEYLLTPPSREKLKALIAASGRPLRELMRRKGTRYDELALDDPKWSDEQLVELMLADPILINRPIVETPLGTRLCRPPEDVLPILPVAGSPLLNPKTEDTMRPASQPLALIDDELELLADLVPLAGQDIIELGCGAAALARKLLSRYPDSRVTGLEVDERQHAKNLAAPQAGLHFMAGVAQAIPSADARFDLVLMLKSLHHVPLASMAKALAEAARVLRPGGHLYVSEPVYAGVFNELVRLFNDESVVRAAAQTALDVALSGGAWAQVAERHFEMPVAFKDFAEFEQRMMRPTFADHHIDDAMIARVRTAFAPHAAGGEARFQRPMHVRLLRRVA